MCPQKSVVTDISTVEVARTKRVVQESPVDSINFDVPMEIVASTQHLSAIIRTIVETIPMNLRVVSFYLIYYE